MSRWLLSLLLLVLVPASVQAWWNEEWAYRKQITLDTTTTGAAIAEAQTDFAVLVRLHTGNFGYFWDVQDKGRDIRFVADDDQTPLKFEVEKFDPVNEMALIWVQLPELPAGSNTRSVWMYYGNPAAVAGDDPNGIFDVNQVAAFHFADEASAARDATAFQTHAASVSAQVDPGSLIGSGLALGGSEEFRISGSPVLQVNPESGWTASLWVKIDQPQGDGRLLDVGGTVSLHIDGQAPYARLASADGTTLQTPANGSLVPGTWHHLALVLAQTRISVFLDGREVSYLETSVPSMGGDIVLGATASAGPAAEEAVADGEEAAVSALAGFSGQVDEFRIANVARSAAWLSANWAAEGPGSTLLIYGEDGQQGSEGGGEASYFAITLHNVTVDGWVVIVILAVMAAISWVVMFVKGMVIGRTRKDNAAFLEDFESLGAGEIGDLDSLDIDEERELQASPLMTALGGRHEHYESSSLYRIYHAGVDEMMNRVPKAVGAQAVDLALTPQAINAIRATMDGTLVRENQKLNSQMVLLTIAISGGPFLGLLGTVVGVMITFAAIAAAGDVNVNAIAPGIAAALVATVAGLVVAIPALFGYNYLGSRIKEVSADMHVFVDEFVARIAEQHG